MESVLVRVDGSEVRIEQVVNHGAIPALCQMLDRADAKVRYAVY